MKALDMYREGRYEFEEKGKSEVFFQSLSHILKEGELGLNLAVQSCNEFAQKEGRSLISWVLRKSHGSDAATQAMWDLVQALPPYKSRESGFDFRVWSLGGLGRILPEQTVFLRDLIQLGLFEGVKNFFYEAEAYEVDFRTVPMDCFMIGDFLGYSCEGVPGFSLDLNLEYEVDLEFLQYDGVGTSLQYAPEQDKIHLKLLKPNKTLVLPGCIKAEVDIDAPSEIFEKLNNKERP